jgi:hypothetical protein
MIISNLAKDETCTFEMMPPSDGVLRESGWESSARERVNEWFVYVGSQDIQRVRGSL